MPEHSLQDLESRTPEQIKYWHRMLSIEALSLAVDHKIEELVPEEASPGIIEDTESRISSEIRAMQLSELSRLIIEIAEHENYRIPLDLDDAGMITRASPSCDEFIEEMVKPAEILGTNDLLELLVPEDVTDPEIRAMYYLPWRKELLRKHCYVHDNSDGSAISVRQTRIPNLRIFYTYPAGCDVPRRTIGLSQS